MTDCLEINHLDGDMGLTNKIKKALLDASRSFIYIGFLLDEADNLNYYKEHNFESIYDYCENEFGFKRSSTNNFIRVYRQFGEHMGLKSGFESYNYSQLVEMCSLPETSLNDVSPNMTISSIRNLKANLIDNKKDIIVQTSGQNKNTLPVLLNNIWADIPKELIFQLIKFFNNNHNNISSNAKCYDITLCVHKNE